MITTIKDYFINTFLIIASLVLIMSCDNRSKPSNNEIEIKKEDKLGIVIEKQNSWPENNKTKDFKVDSTNFEIQASKTSWRIKLERTSSFDNQFINIKKAINQISKETDLKKLRKVVIEPINHELLSDIASVTEIQSELIRRNGKINSMGTVSQNAYKAKFLNGITNLFQQYELESYDYYIDKCHGKKTEGDSVFYTIHCSSIYFKLKEIDKE